jgi:hypothetical protein
MLTSAQKLTFRAYAPFPELLLFFKYTLGVVFCEGIQHRLPFSLDHLNCVKMAAFQFYLQSEKQRKVVWGPSQASRLGGERQLKFTGENGSVKRCVVLMQQKVLLFPKFGVKSSHIFMQSPLNVTVVCGIDCLAFQDEFFVNDPLDVKKNDEHVFHFALHLSRLFRFP